MRFNFAFCCERIKAIQTIKITIVFGDIFLNNADYFFIERYCDPPPFRMIKILILF